MPISRVCSAPGTYLVRPPHFYILKLWIKPQSTLLKQSYSLQMYLLPFVICITEKKADVTGITRRRQEYVIQIGWNSRCLKLKA